MKVTKQCEPQPILSGKLYAPICEGSQQKAGEAEHRMEMQMKKSAQALQRCFNISAYLQVFWVTMDEKSPAI